MAYFRKRGEKWSARVTWYDETGTRRTKEKAGFPTKRQAQVWANEIEVAKADGQIQTDDPVFAEYFLDWVDTYKKLKVSPRVLKRYYETYRALKKYFGSQRLSKMNKRKYQQFVNDYGHTRAKATVHNTFGYVAACVKNAVDEGYIKINFTKGIEIVYDPTRTKKVDYLSLNEIRLLIKTLESDIKPSETFKYIILTAIYTGMRIGEILALTWSDIDFDEKTITINKSYDYHSHQIKQPKTKHSNRTIRINQSLLDLLNQLDHSNEFIFTSKTGTMPVGSSCNRYLKEYLKKCNIDRQNFHFHSLRHSHVAMLLYEGVDLYAISKRLGHADLTTTSTIYAYLIDELKQKSDNHIEEILDNLG